jgi:hypothetical protein
MEGEMENLLKYIRKINLFFLAATLICGLATTVHADIQMVSLSPHNVAVAPGSNVKLALYYDVAGPVKESTGLAIRIHFDSRVIESVIFEEMYGEGLYGVGETPRADLNNVDEDAETDMYQAILWMGMQGDWPSMLKPPLGLGTVSLKIRSDTTQQATKIHITSTSKPAGFDFVGKDAVITIK